MASVAGFVLACTLSLAVAQDAGTQVAANAPAGADAPAVPEFNPKAGGAKAAEGTEFHALDADVQDLKKQVLDLNKDLFLLEEELLFPSNTQVAVFVSMDVGDFFGLDSVSPVKRTFVALAAHKVEGALMNSGLAPVVALQSPDR